LIILHSYKCYITIFATAGNENGIGRSPDQFFPVWWKGSGNETRCNLSPWLCRKTEAAGSNFQRVFHRVLWSCWCLRFNRKCKLSTSFT